MPAWVVVSGVVWTAVPALPVRATAWTRPSSVAMRRQVDPVRRSAIACSGLTYNHESPRRPEQFVTRKVTRGAAAIKLGLERELVLGDLDAVRDWSHAADVVRAAWLALQADEPGDYVIASGVGRTVRDFVAAAFAAVELDWEGHVRVDPAFVRAPEPVALVGDPTRARERLGWAPERSFEDLVAEMVAADLAALRR